jgi:hypothetical protein
LKIITVEIGKQFKMNETSRLEKEIIICGYLISWNIHYSRKARKVIPAKLKCFTVYIWQ